MLVICKHWNWNSHWDWKFHIFKTVWWQHLPSYVTFWSGCHVTIFKSDICLSAITMATKLGRVVTCGGGTPPSKSRHLLIPWSRDKFRKLISTLLQYLWPWNLAGCQLTVGRSHIPSQMTFWSNGHVTNIKTYICTPAIPMATKLGRVVTWGRGTQPSTSGELFITWSRDKFKKLMSALP